MIQDHDPLYCDHKECQDRLAGRSIRKMKVGIIGADGRMGRLHAQNVVDSGCELTDADRADFVVIASPDNTHAQYAIRHLKRGQAVFCEKPLATNMDDLDRMAQLAEKIPLGCHLPLRLRAEEFEIPTDCTDVFFAYYYGRTEKFLLGWRNSPDYDCLLGGGIHMVDLALQKIGPGKPYRAEWKKTHPHSRCPDWFEGGWFFGDTRIEIGVYMTSPPPHRHFVNWFTGQWSNEQPSDKTTQLRNFLSNPQTDILAIASHRACIEFRAVA